MNKAELIEHMKSLQKIIKSQKYEIAEAKEQCRRKDLKIAELKKEVARQENINIELCKELEVKK